MSAKGRGNRPRNGAPSVVIAGEKIVEADGKTAATKESKRTGGAKNLFLLTA